MPDKPGRHKTKTQKPRLRFSTDQVWRMFTAAFSAFGGVSVLFIAAMIGFEPSKITGDLLVALLCFCVSLPLSILAFAVTFSRLSIHITSRLFLLDLVPTLYGVYSLLEHLHELVGYVFLGVTLLCLMGLGLGLQLRMGSDKPLYTSDGKHYHEGFEDRSGSNR